MPISSGATKITDYVDVRKKMIDLGCRSPERLALLPVNFESAASITEFLQASEAATVRKLFLAKGLPVDDIWDRSRRPPYVKNKSHEWVAPIVFISASLYSQNQELISVALDVLGNYATDFLKGMGGARNVGLNIVVEKRDKTCKKISYEGPIEGLKDLAKIIREVGE